MVQPDKRIFFEIKGVTARMPPHFSPPTPLTQKDARGQCYTFDNDTEA